MRSTVLPFKRAGDQANASRGPKFSFELWYHWRCGFRSRFPVFMQGRIIFVTQPVVHGEGRRELPFILREEDVIVLLQETVTGDPAVQRVRRAYVAQNLH